MIGLSVRLGTNKRTLNIYSCTEIKDLSSTYAYLNYADIEKSKAKKIYYKNICFGVPRLVNKENRRGLMTVATKRQALVIDGRYGDLLTLYDLCDNLQKGLMFCKYCKKEKDICQIEGFLKELNSEWRVTGFI